VLIKPVQRSTVVDGIVNQIMDQILTGELKPGTKLPTEVDLTDELAVGRSSVREALKVLEALGLLERSREGTVVSIPGSGFMVRLLSVMMATRQITPIELLEARVVLEVALAGYAAEKATKEDLAKAARSVDIMQHAIAENIKLDYIQANVDFHIIIAAAAQNSFLFQVVEAVREALTNFQKEIYDVPGLLQVSLEQHKAIYGAIKQGNSSAARLAMQKHLDYIVDLYNSHHNS